MKYFEHLTIPQPYVPFVMDHSTDLFENADSDFNLWQVGQLVSLTEPSYGIHNPSGSVGVVYMVDTDDPASPYLGIIMESGDDLGLIEASYIHDSFISLGRKPFDYQFVNCQTLMSDQVKGVFLPYFQIARNNLNNG